MATGSLVFDTVWFMEYNSTNSAVAQLLMNTFVVNKKLSDGRDSTLVPLNHTLSNTRFPEVHFCH